MEALVNARGFRKCTHWYSSCVPLFVFVSRLGAEKNKVHGAEGPGHLCTNFHGAGVSRSSCGYFLEPLLYFKPFCSCVLSFFLCSFFQWFFPLCSLMKTINSSLLLFCATVWGRVPKFALFFHFCALLSLLSCCSLYRWYPEQVYES